MGEDNKLGWMAPAAAIGGGIVSQGLGLLLGAHNDRRQLKQQQKLQALQMAGNKEMTDYSYAKQLEMWEKTGYGAQKEQMKEAGLNPALMYGMGGGGGQSVGTGGGAGVSGGNAPVGGGEQQAAAGMGIQMAMLKGQLDVMASQAEKNRADAEATKGYQKDLALGSLAKMAQETDNLRWTYEIQRLEKALKDQAVYKGEKTLEAEINNIIAGTRSKMAQANVDEQTQQAKIDQMQAAAIGETIKNRMMEKGMEVNDAQIQKMAADIAQGWANVAIGDKNAATQAWKAAMEAGNPGLFNVLGGELQRTIEAIWNAFGSERPQYKQPKK